MSAPYSSGDYRYHALGRAYWLPPGGIGNGLDAESWVPLVDVRADQARELLQALFEASVAAYSAQVHRTGRKVPATTVRIYVDTWTHARAEDVVARSMPHSRDAGV